MIRSTFVVAIGLALGLAPVAAEDFPLEYQPIPPKDVMSFPGGYGVYAQLRLAKPKGIKAEPKPVSKRPIYGECRQGSASPVYCFRLDESKGSGTGYDQLILDLNQDGDLNGEPAFQPVTPDNAPAPAPAQNPRQLLFGPIQLPKQAPVAGGVPRFFAQAYVNDLSYLGENREAEGVYAGQLRLKAGWYLQTTVNLPGVREKVGLFDANSNLKLGDLSYPETYVNDGQTNWYFQPGDSLLVDDDGNGRFENDAFGSESCTFGPVAYFDADPCRITLQPDCKALSVTAWTDPLAEVTLQPRGDQVRSLTLAWEQPDGKWQLLRAGVVNGKVKVPPGNYRLYSCALLGKAAPKEQVMVSGFLRLPRAPEKFVAGQPNTLRCGGPLSVEVTAEKRTPESWETIPTPKNRDLDSDFILRINAHAVGGAGETYSSFGKGEKFRDDPPQPIFTISDAGGKRLANGNLEYG
jgi:hypothetical protein